MSQAIIDALVFGSIGAATIAAICARNPEPPAEGCKECGNPRVTHGDWCGPCGIGVMNDAR